jgi:uncharacterized membrane protein
MSTRLLWSATLPYLAAGSLIVLRWALYDRWWPWLLFNLFLGWLPLGLAWAATRPRRWAWAWAVPWLLFLPNAPYLVSDLIHYAERPPVPSWFDAAMIGAVAGAGLLGGALSALSVQRAVAGRLPRGGQVLFVAVVCLLSGRAIELGRVQRHNSWDALLDPWPVVEDLVLAVVFPLQHAQVWGIALVYAVLLGAWWTALGAAWSDVQRAVPDRGAPAE